MRQCWSWSSFNERKCIFIIWRTTYFENFCFPFKIFMCKNCRHELALAGCVYYIILNIKLIYIVSIIALSRLLAPTHASTPSNIIHFLSWSPFCADVAWMVKYQNPKHTIKIYVCNTLIHIYLSQLQVARRTLSLTTTACNIFIIWYLIVARAREKRYRIYRKYQIY